MWKLRNLDRLVIIADFDRTVTTAFVTPGKNGMSSHGILESCSVLSAEYRKKSKALVDKYLPIEFDPGLSIAQKLPIMQEWYRQGHSLLLQEPVTENVIRKAVAEANVRIRPGFAELQREAQAHGIPLVVFSAGLGNVVREVLRQRVEGGEGGWSDRPVCAAWRRRPIAAASPLRFPGARAAPSARLVPLTAQAAPTRPGAPPPPLGASPWPQPPALGRPKV